MLGFLFTAEEARSQFLRLGPFDFTGVVTVQGVYTTNVDGERASEATDAMEDYYLITGLSLNSQAVVTPNTELNVDTGFTVEQHARRPDLDNSSSPFGRFRVSSSSKMRYLTLSADASLERTMEASEDVYVPGNRKTRDVTDHLQYGAGLDWRRGKVFAGGSYAFSQERHLQPEFQDGDRDETTIAFSTGCDLVDRVTLSYGYEQKKDELVYQPTSAGDEWDKSQDVGVTLRILDRPRFSYRLAYEKENDEPWDWTHTFDLSDDVSIFKTSTLELKVGATYSIEQEKDAEEDDIAFTYHAALEHQLSRTAKQTLRASREPVETFGSTSDTDQTTVGYTLRKDDLFVYGLNLTFGATYERSEPLGQRATEIEQTMSYATELVYARAITRRLKRALSYRYTVDDSNLEMENLEEHRVTLTFDYLL